MNAIVSLFLVIALFLVALIGAKVQGLQYMLGVIIPYLAFFMFVIGLIYRVTKWAKAPVPFRIPTTCGQQKSLPWIKHNELDNPSTTWGVIKRMTLEVLLFRSLFRNTTVELAPNQRVAYGPDKLLWLAGLAFHYTFLVILIRHVRLFTDPIPFVVEIVESLDGFLQILSPTFYLSSLIFLAALSALLLRRIYNPQVRYISLPADYFPLFLILAIGITGIFMRYITKVDIEAVKQTTLALTSLSFSAPESGIGAMFYAHLFLVSILLAYFPFSKLLHGAGVFMSPTRNLANNNREKHHANPWDYPVKTHHYHEYEDEFREKMVKMGIPVDKPIETSAEKEE